MPGLRPGWCTVATAITLTRAALVAVVLLLVLDGPPAGVTVALATVALLLDLADGYAARRFDCVTELGARLDMEVDAALILVLSLAVARGFGWWVLAIGLARYVFGLAALVRPWLRAPMPAARWRKVVAAVQGVTLTAAVSGVLPRALIGSALAVALALLVVSFGTQVSYLRRQDPAYRRSVFWTAGALFLVWFALLLPDRWDEWSPAAFVRVPIEALLVAGLALVLTDGARRGLAATAGLLLGALLLIKALDVGFYDVLDRPFNPVTDQSSFGPAFGVLQDSVGHAWAVAVAVLVALAAVTVLVLMPLCVLRLTRVAARRRRMTARSLVALGVVWALGAALGLHGPGGVPLAASTASHLTYDHVRAVGDAIEDARRFAALLHDDRDRMAAVPPARVLTKLRGKDVLLVFVESYGQTALRNTATADLLRSSTAELAAAGYGSRSAFMTSPTFGGVSWLAHSTMQAGLWVDNQSRYDALVDSDRYTLTTAFGRAGWRTVSDVPSNTGDWPEGRSFYGFDALYNSSSTNYRGPRFGYARIPDQYTLAALRARELARPGHRPVFAEIDLDSSHTPWNPLPAMLSWDAVWSGRNYTRQRAGQPSTAQVWKSSERLRANYDRSIRYSLTALVSYLTTFRDRNLVVVMLGDHQPWTRVSGRNPSHDVPVSIIADDPSVLAAIDSWHWDTGLLPGPSAATSRMDEFRDRFLHAYGAASAAR